ncbi:MAG: HD domain-containing phosphohydrolase, partial [Myxococcota bacterium]|nr:HD domain-containing phosphohydrolase [Myxococcota bacterium]
LRRMVMSEEVIDSSQAQLGKTLERARMGEDKGLAALVRDLGERLVRLFYGLLKMTEIHDLGNKAFEKPIAEFVNTGTELMDILGAIHIVTVEDQVFVNDIRIRLNQAKGASTLSDELLHHEIGGISFHSMPDQIQFKRFITLISGKALSDTPRATLIEFLSQEGLEFIDLTGIYRFRISGEGTVVVTRSMEKVSARAASLVEDSWDNLGNNRVPNPLPLRRAVTDILEHSKGDVAGLSSGEKNSGYGFHALQVCRFTLLIAKEARLSEEAIQDIGVTAMFHDMGYAAREGADPEKGEEGYPPPFERHGIAGARLLLRQRGFNQAKINRALATLEHHWDYVNEKGTPSLFARIIRIAEDYANMIRYKGGGYNPHEALARMAAGAGSRYDPDLLQVFINKMGKYPPGTLLEVEVELRGNPVVFILCSNSLVREPESFDKPICRLIRLHDGRDVPAKLANRPIDLMKKGKILRVVRDF